jgi:hypothetical protein
MALFIRFTDTARLDMSNESNDTLHGGSMGGVCGFKLDADIEWDILSDIKKEAIKMANKYAKYYPHYTRENNGFAIYEGDTLPVYSNDGVVFSPKKIIATLTHA